MIKVTKREVGKAEEIAERIAMGYIGVMPSDEISAAMQSEYKSELAKEGIPEGLVTLYLNQQTGCIFIYQPEKMINDRTKYIQ